MKSNKTKKMKKRILALLLCMVMMLNGSVSALANEVTNETKALSEDTHVHGEECYTRTKVSEELKCGKEVVEGHTHGDTCYEVTNTPECICTLEETEGHSHDDSCFETEEIQVCTLEEHEHGGGCYTTEKELTCGQEESEEHTHDDGCYKENVECICEIDEHSHGSDCYITDTKNICGQEEKEAHFHGDACYTAVENKTLTCQLEEIESHTHGDECYEWLEELVCEIEAEELVPEEISEETVIVCETCQKEKCECEKKVENSLIQTLGETTVELSGAEEAFEAEKTYALQVNELEEEAAVMVAAAIKDVTRTANLEVLDYQAFDITLTADEEAAQPKAEVEVKFTGAKIEEYVATEDAEVKAFHVDAEGNAEEVSLTEGENEVSITTDHFSTYVVANVKTAEPVVLTTEVDGTTITLSGPVSAFAEGKTYEITAAKVEAEEELEVIEEALEEVAEEQEKVVESYQAFDIKIMATGEDGVTEEFQPLGPVQVTFSGEMVAESVANEETETNVIHVDTATGETQDMGATATEENDVAIETTHFSIYVVVDMNQLGGEISLSVQHWANLSRLSGVDGSDGLIESAPYDGVAGNATASLAKVVEFIEIYNSDTLTLYNNTSKTVDELSKVLLASRDKPVKNYNLSEVWVLKAGKNENSTTRNDWTIYNANSTEELRLDANTTIRLVYTPNTTADAVKQAVTFFDYNITNGTVQSGNKIDTANKGINTTSNFNGGNTNKRLAVGMYGNGVDHSYESVQHNGLFVNKGNAAGGFTVVTNMVTGVNDNGPIYNGLYDAGLFNNSTKIGKKVFTNYQLGFNQIGDTYILSKVYKGSDVALDNLDTFREIYDKGNKHIFSNNFWPLDTCGTYDGRDPLLGGNTKYYAKSDNQNLGASDDNQAHNWFFGMRYDFQFEIGDYTGPLNYYFRGDDDFWLFVDGELKTDIGGIHSSVGANLDLNYLKEQDLDETHHITIIYAERGGYGSSCYMEFTIPNVRPVTIDAPEKTDITVTKVWNDDNSSFRPNSITLKLFYQENDSSDWLEYPDTKTLTVSNTNGSDTNQWIGVWKDLPKEGYTYKVVEITGLDTIGYEVKYGDGSKDYLELNGINNSGMITNSLNPPAKVTVTKVWDDFEKIVDSRPATVNFQLLWRETGKTEWSVYPGDKAILTLDGTVDGAETSAWYGEYLNLPVYNQGKAIEYTIRELNVDNNIIEANGSLEGKGSNFTYTVTYTENTKNYPICANSVVVTNKLDTKNLGIIKHSSEDENRVLFGAKFELKHVTIADLEWTGVSDSNGCIVFNDLPNGEYILTETEAPIGHCLLEDDITIVVSNEGIKADSDALTTKIVEDVMYYELKVSNEPVYQLPSTGGMGTEVFKIGGLALMSGAALFLHKKKEDEEV